MENLKLQEQVLNLGRLFVKELKLEPGVDTFSRWMAHYLAEKITIAEQSIGPEKEILEKECFDVILKLWEHRNSFPPGRRPLEKFEPILDILDNINPDKERYYFNDLLNIFNIEKSEVKIMGDKSSKEWMLLAQEIDKVARTWIQYAICQAINDTEDKNTALWIKNTEMLADDNERLIIEKLLNDNQSSKSYDVEKLEEKIAQLQKYSELNETLLKAFKTELEKLSD